jgi:hypothetical protein
MRRLKRPGQSLTELAVLIATVTAAILGMQLYVQRGLQARHKGGMEYFFNKIEQSAGKIYHQYEPYYWEGSRSVTTDSNTLRGYPDSAENSVSTQSGLGLTGSAENAD